MDARFVRGEAEMMNYTPSGADVAVGQVVLVNDAVGICHRLIKDGELGALGIDGGFYEFKGDAAISQGNHVYWDNSAKKATETIGSNKYLGVAASACTGNNALFEVHHVQPTSSAAGS